MLAVSWVCWKRACVRTSPVWNQQGKSTPLSQRGNSSERFSRLYSEVRDIFAPGCARILMSWLQTFYGTKDLIEDYINEEVKALEFVRESPDLSNEEKRRFFKGVNTNLGTSALCLSGGASFGYCEWPRARRTCQPSYVYMRTQITSAW